ncbi:MAG: hypothetical protein IPO86_09590 [Saprospiraceae bacterium]|nr:hypothetical protein [Saprospiraceae bacterium]MBK9728357.1 hypothetical protein [Saprospiraceae bacterium]
MSLFVVTGDIGTGKTSYLKDWLSFRTDVGGFLSPVIDSKRHFMLLKNSRMIAMEAALGSQNLTFDIGKYKFLKSSFLLATHCLITDWNAGLRYCILDEFGPLEFNNLGLMPDVLHILQSSAISEKQHLIVVVRNSLIEKFNELYTIDKLFSITELKELQTGFLD